MRSKMSKQDEITVKLHEQPNSIQLAVDLIQLLEENQIDISTAIEALEITLNDYKNKASNKK